MQGKEKKSRGQKKRKKCEEIEKTHQKQEKNPYGKGKVIGLFKKHIYIYRGGKYGIESYQNGNIRAQNWK